MKLRSTELLVLGVFLVCALLLSFFVTHSYAAEPTLVDILNNLGFTNISASSVETFAAGTYNITLYAEFADYHYTNELSYYQVGTNIFNLIFTGPEGGYQYVVPPLNKSFTANYQFGLSLRSGTHRYFTQRYRNEYHIQHAQVYENLDDPGMFLIGFENGYGYSGDRDYNDMVFSIKPYTPPVEHYLNVETDPPSLVTIPGEGWYSDGTNVSLTAPEFVSASGIRYRFDYWDFDGTPKGTGVNPITVHMDANHTATAHYIAQYYLTVVSPYGIPGGEGWYDGGGNAYATLNTGTIDHGNGTRRLFTSWGGDASGTNYATSNPTYMDQNKTAIANWKTQYYLTMSTNFGTVSPSDDWHDAGSIVSISATPPTTVSGEQYVWNGWTGTGSGLYSGLDNPASITMNGPITETASWTHQYYLTVTSLYDTAGGEGWYDSGSTAYATLSTGVVDHGNGTRRVFTSWSGDASGTSYSSSDPILMNAPKTAIANWKVQYSLTLETNPGSVTTPSGDGWYDAGVYASISTDELVDIVSGSSRYKFINWTTADISEITNPASPSTTVLMDKPKTATANYKIQYFITFDQSGIGVDFTGTLVTIDGSDYDVGDLSIAFWWDEGSTHSFSFYSPLIVTPYAKRYVWESTTGLSTLQTDSITITAAGSVTGNYKTQYYLTVTSSYDTPGGEGWYDGGGNAYATLSTGVVDHGNGTRRVFTSWSGDASGTDYDQSDPILMDGPKTALAGWKTQYYLTLTTTAGGVTNPLSSGWYDAGTIVTATAIPDIDYVFDHWELDSANVGSTNPYSVTMNTAHTLHAVFVYSPPPPTTYYLTVETDPLGVTTISGEGWYDENEDVSLTAPNYIDVSSGARYKFSYWDVDGTAQGTSVNSIIVHMDTNHTATAHYILQYYLTVKTHPSGIASIPGQGWYDISISVPLTAPSVSGYVFLYWDVDGVPQGTGVTSISVNMNSYHTATANYERESPIVGGSTVSIKSPLLHTWIGLSVMFIVAIFIVASWIKKRRRKD